MLELMEKRDIVTRRLKHLQGGLQSSSLLERCFPELLPESRLQGPAHSAAMAAEAALAAGLDHRHTMEQFDVLTVVKGEMGREVLHVRDWVTSEEFTVKGVAVGWRERMRAPLRLLQGHPLVATPVGMIEEPPEGPTQPPRLYVVTRRASQGCLRDWISQGGRPLGADHRPPSPQAVLQEVLQALAFAHSRGVAHGNLQADHVLLQPDGHIALSDFGMESPASGVKQGSTPCKSPSAGVSWGWACAAPETEAGEGWAGEARAGEARSCALDSWAVGSLILDLLNSPECSQMGTLGPHPHQLADLAAHLMRPDPQHRMSVHQALLHPFFTSPPLHHRLHASDPQAASGESPSSSPQPVPVANLSFAMEIASTPGSGSPGWTPGWTPGATPSGVGSPGCYESHEMQRWWLEHAEGEISRMSVQQGVSEGPPHRVVVRGWDTVLDDMLHAFTEADAECLGRRTHVEEADVHASSCMRPRPLTPLPSQGPPQMGEGGRRADTRLISDLAGVVGAGFGGKGGGGRPAAASGGHIAGAELAPALFHYLQRDREADGRRVGAEVEGRVEWWLLQLGAYDAAEAAALRECLLTVLGEGSELRTVGMFVGATEGEPLHDGDDAPLSDVNKPAAVARRAHWILIGHRRAALEALRHGFQSVPGIAQLSQDVLSQLSEWEVGALFYGREYLHLPDIQRRVLYAPEWDQSPGDAQVRPWVDLFLRSITPSLLRVFLAKATGRLTLTTYHTAADVASADDTRIIVLKGVHGELTASVRFQPTTRLMVLPEVDSYRDLCARMVAALHDNAVGTSDAGTPSPAHGLCLPEGLEGTPQRGAFDSASTSPWKDLAEGSQGLLDRSGDDELMTVSLEDDHTYTPQGKEMENLPPTITFLGGTEIKEIGAHGAALVESLEGAVLRPSNRCSSAEGSSEPCTPPTAQISNVSHATCHVAQ
ncbi:hypothetical protein CYMTET_45643 [Cymbomonas tetramitiformis]|uniref:Protein kinase domain-containing protein n=1 Tax=Cymbomonas tetramitiformis TaxID=36881 RepID=A0AAE0BZ69_9CHLO|nr:hypothetical protein CYMTET_45643 [Cymbomonas tetramitiformis]